MTPESRRLNIEEELTQSDEAMRAAEALIDLGLARDALSRLYYAAFHAARAILLSEDLEPTTHQGVLSLLGLHFIKPGHLPPQMAATFRRIQGYREAADYTRGFVMQDDECRVEIADARVFVGAVREHLARAGFIAS